MYGDKVRVSRGVIHDYFGMMISFSGRHVWIYLEDYFRKTINGFVADIHGTAAMPTGAHIFQVRNDSEHRVLGDKKVQFFHSLVAQLLFHRHNICMISKQQWCS